MNRTGRLVILILVTALVAGFLAYRGGFWLGAS